MKFIFVGSVSVHVQYFIDIDVQVRFKTRKNKRLLSVCGWGSVRLSIH